MVRNISQILHPRVRTAARPVHRGGCSPAFMSIQGEMVDLLSADDVFKDV